jgi:hypothetical protein
MKTLGPAEQAEMIIEASAQAVESERRKAGGCQLDGPAFGPF